MKSLFILFVSGFLSNSTLGVMNYDEVKPQKSSSFKAEVKYVRQNNHRNLF